MIKTKNIYEFKKSLECITSLIEEANIRFKTKGLFIKAIDKTQIILVDFSISKDFFDSYRVEPNLLALNIQELSNIISRSFDKDKLILDIKDDYLDILFKGKIERDFNVPYIDLSKEEINLPEITYTATFDILAGLLKEIIKDVSLIASTLIFRIADNKLYIEAEGERGKIKTLLPHVKIKSKDMYAKYSLSFLRNITKNMNPDVNLVLKFSEDSPLFINYSVNEHINIKYYLSSMLI